MSRLQDSLRKNLRRSAFLKPEASQTIKVIEGIGSSNDVNYAYTLSQSQWYATYELRVHRSLLDKACRIQLNKFAVGGKKWRIFVTHLENGKIVAGLQSRNWNPVKVHYSFTLINHNSMTKNMCKNSSDTFLLGSYKEVDSIMTSSEIKDPSSGYLKNDMFTLRMDVRIKCRSSEVCCLSVNEQSVKCKWKLKHAWEMCPPVMVTDVFKVGHQDMQLEYREERSFCNEKCVSVLLKNLSDRSIHVCGKLGMPDHRSSEFMETIDAGAVKGWNQILTEKDFFDDVHPVVWDSWLTLFVEIVLFPKRDFDKAVLSAPIYTTDERLPESDVHATSDIEEGRGVFRGVEYAHRIKRNRWCALYEWHVHQSFLESKNKFIISNPFAVDGTYWYIAMKHTEDGRLEGYLFSKNSTPVTAQFEFTLVNFDNTKKNVGKGNCHTFSFVDDHMGVSFLPSVEIKSTSSGFFEETFIVARLDLRLKQEENECCQISVDGRSAMCKWKLKLLNEMNPLYLRSEKFELGGSDLQVLLRQNSKTHSDSLDIIISKLNHESIGTKGEVRAVNYLHPKNNRVQDFCCVLSPDNQSSLEHFLGREELEKEELGFVRDGWITLEIQIKLLDEQEFNIVAADASKMLEELPQPVPETILDELMHVEEKNGSWDGCAYKSTLNKYKYYATYECRVHRDFLENKDKQIVTEPFELHDRKWNVILMHNNDGQLKAYLYNKGDERVTTHFSFILVNCADNKRDRVNGDLRTFSPETCQEKWGFNLCPIEMIKDPSSGFLQDDWFTVRLELRLSLGENESWKTTITPRTASCTWKLKDLKDLSPLLLKSEIFRIGETEWRLRVCPNGETLESEGMELYLINKQKYPVRTKIEFRITNFQSLDHLEDRIQGFTKIIEAQSGWGYGQFLKSNELNDESLGFVEDGWIKIEAEVTVLNEFKIVRSQSCESSSTRIVLQGTAEKFGYYDSSGKIQQKSLNKGQERKCPECQELLDRIVTHDVLKETQALQLCRCKSALVSIPTHAGTSEKHADKPHVAESVM